MVQEGEAAEGRLRSFYAGSSEAIRIIDCSSSGPSSRSSCHATPTTARTSPLSSSTGTVATQYTYDPYGATTVTGPPGANTSEFAGMRHDGSTGMYFDNARYYSHGEGRFVSQDPVGFAGGTPNLYQYASASPTMNVDRTGTWELTTGQKIIIFIFGVGIVCGLVPALCLAACT